MSESGQMGQLLAQARETQELSLQQVANELKLSVSFVKAIEAEQCSSLPDVAFVRGYVRNYARLLGLSKEQTQQVVAHFETIMAPAKEAAQGVPVVAPKTQGPRWWRLLWLIAVVAIIAQAFYMWQNAKAPAAQKEALLPKAETVAPQESTQEDRAVDAAASSAPALPDTIDENAANSNADALDKGADENAAPPATSGLEGPATDVQETSETNEAVEEAAIADLVLTFADECWVSVTDSTGRALFSGIKQGGEELRLDGNAPYRFVFGNGAALESMRIKGDKVALPERRAGQIWRYSSNELL